MALALVLPLCEPPAAATSGDPLTPEERAWLEAHGPIRYAPDPAYPPFEFVDERGNVSGINVDFLNRMSRNLRFEFEVVYYDNWTLILDALKRGEVDLLGSAARTPDREAYADFVGPYMRVGEVFYVNADRPELRSVEDLAGKNVAVVEEYAAGKWLARNHPEIKLVTVPDIESGLDKVAVGEVDAFFDNIPVGGYYIRENSLNNVRILGEPLYYSDANWVVPKDQRLLLSIIDKGMQSIPPGEQTSVFEYWTGYDLGFTAADPRSISPLARNIIGGVAGAGLLVGAWSISLRRTVASRTRDVHRSKLELEAVNARLEEDVRRRREAEEEVRRLNADLERRVRERTAELSKLNQDLEAFSYTVSHDLRTRLAAMTSYNAILRKKYADSLGEEGLRYVEKSSAATVRMQQLIDDILNLSRASRLQIEPQRVDLTEVAEQTLQTLRDRDPARRVECEVAPGLAGTGDPRLLRILMENLLENAWKYTRRREDARIEFGVEDRGRGERAFFVRDNGVGFSPAEQGRLFETFHRLPSAAGFEGTGIGLSTVKRIVERHGGEVWARGEPDRGATFYFSLRGES